MFVALQNLGCGTSLFDLTRCLWRPPETTGERQVDGADTAKALQTQSITVIGNSGHYVIEVCGADSLQRDFGLDYLCGEVPSETPTDHRSV
jgi:hypothetical protein